VNLTIIELFNYLIMFNDMCVSIIYIIIRHGLITSMDASAVHPPLFSFVPDTMMDSQVAVAFYGVVYAVGLILIVTSTFSKMLSHDIIGYYAWFWGDFFFKIDKTLKFDGIFEVFPHPMYTVGYAWMYGSAMISGSFQVLALTMFSHLMQMGFLGYVEDPHIQRTYGVEFEKSKSTHHENIFIIHNFDPFRASDWMMVIILVLFVVTTIICGGVLGMEPLVSENYFIGTALLTTVLGKLGIAFLLYKQGKTRFWTSHFLKAGMSKEKAFDEWKRIQNLADNLVILSFLVLSWRMFQWPEMAHVLLNRWVYVCGFLFFLIMIGVSYWSADECYSALGDYGWFYGDFFLLSKDSDGGEGYVARGIYRYFSHPDIVFGKFWLYALALVCGSSDVAAIAMINHALSLAQLITIEEPHMQRIYQRKIKRSGGVMDTLKKLKIGGKKHR
jgi:phosphatidylethanolamine N-methyltransferase